jgi:hypothetical protein
MKMLIESTEAGMSSIELEGTQTCPNGYVSLSIKGKGFYTEVNAQNVYDAIGLMLAIAKRDDTEFNENKAGW